DHRSQHHFQPVRACRVNRAAHLGDAAGLHDLEVHAVHAAGEVGDVGGVMTALVGEHRDAAPLPHPLETGQVLARHRLLHQLDAQRLDLAQHAHRVGGVPRGVGVDPQATVVAAPDALEVLDVAGSAELDLED